MLAIYFDNGDFLFGTFFQGHAHSDMGSIYNLFNADSLAYNKGKIANIRLDKDGWWYPVDRIVKFKDITEDEAIQLQRDDKLIEVLQ